MKKGINQWAFPASMPTRKAMSQAHELGFESIELCVGESGPVPLDVSEQEVTALRRHAARNGLEIGGIATTLGWQYPLTSPDPAIQARGREIVERLLHIAHWAGAGTVLVVPGVVDATTAYDEAIERAINVLTDLLPVAEQLQVTLAVENVWNKFLLSPIEMRDFVDQFESPYLGAYVDVGNLIVNAYPEQWIRILGRRVRRVHMKDFRASTGTLDGFVMLMEGDVDWPAVMAALRAAGYSGPLTAEYGPYKHSADAALRHVSAALDIIRGL